MITYFVIAYLTLGLFFGGLSFFAIMSWSHNAGWKSLSSLTTKEWLEIIFAFILFVIFWPYIVYKNFPSKLRGKN